MNAMTPNESVIHPDAEITSELLELAESGDAGAFEKLALLHRTAVMGAILRKMANPHDQDDIWQETWIAAWLGLNGIRDGARFGSWLCQIAARKAMSWLFKTPPSPRRTSCEGRRDRCHPDGYGNSTRDQTGC
jgi:hypothetical protein